MLRDLCYFCAYTISYQIRLQCLCLLRLCSSDIIVRHGPRSPAYFLECNRLIRPRRPRIFPPCFCWKRCSLFFMLRHYTFQHSMRSDLKVSFWDPPKRREAKLSGAVDFLTVLIKIAFVCLSTSSCNVCFVLRAPTFSTLHSLLVFQSFCINDLLKVKRTLNVIIFLQKLCKDAFATKALPSKL